MDTISVMISSITGNTQKIADAVLKELENNLDSSIKVDIFHNKEFLTVSSLSDYILLFFWCRKSTLDDYSQALIEQCKGKKILALGTMGGNPDGTYGERVRKNVEMFIEKNNVCCGVYLSQGKIPEKRTKYRMNLPKDHPHYLDEEGVKRHEQSRSHPDKKDLENAVDFFRKHFQVGR